jgi:deoxycytidine triphosphate deaminase
MGLEIPLPNDFSPPVGLLTDADIKKALAKGFLFEQGTCTEANAKYASYEIRVGGFFEILRFEGSTVSHLPREADAGSSIEISPGSTVLITAEEVFRIPTDVFAKVTTVGQIFSSGLAAENTFADPGYTGPLYITVSNISTRTLSIKKGDPLARVEFHRLAQPVEKPHLGYQGRRPSFVRAMVDTKVREMLRDKTIKELLEEMVNRSVDDALHHRFARSEILIEKAHLEIEGLRLAQSALKRFRYLSAFLVGMVTLFLSEYSGVLNLFVHLPRPWEAFWNVVLALVASAIWFFFEKRFLGSQ